MRRSPRSRRARRSPSRVRRCLARRAARGARASASAVATIMPVSTSAGAVWASSVTPRIAPAIDRRDSDGRSSARSHAMHAAVEQRVRGGRREEPRRVHRGAPRRRRVRQEQPGDERGQRGGRADQAAGADEEQQRRQQIDRRADPREGFGDRRLDDRRGEGDDRRNQRVVPRGFARVERILAPSAPAAFLDGLGDADVAEVIVVVGPGEIGGGEDAGDRARRSAAARRGRRCAVALEAKVGGRSRGHRRSRV